MEQATLPRTSARDATNPGLPPGSRMPPVFQALRYAADPLGFLIRLQRRYGDIFTMRLPATGNVVVVSDPDAYHAATWAGGFGSTRWRMLMN